MNFGGHSHTQDKTGYKEVHTSGKILKFIAIYLPNQST
jgi:hypothetical protein